MTDRFSWILLASAILIALALHLMPGSVYRSPVAMNAYFGFENSPGSWTWEHGSLGSWERGSEPFKYRLVFRGLVDGLAAFFLALGAVQNLQTYWLAFLSISVLSHAFAVWACDRLLQTLGMGIAGRLGGVAAWLALPPILFAYVLPVQTKEDFLAYGLAFLAIRGMLRGDWVFVVALCLIGAFVRETLLIVSLIVLAGTDAPRWVKIAALVLPLSVHAGLRLVLGVDGYEVFRETNLLSMALPVLSLALVFGYAWVPLVRYMARADLTASIRRALSVFNPSLAPGLPSLQQRLAALRSAFPYMLGLLAIAHFFMGRAQEIRITCLLSPFVILALAELFGAAKNPKRCVSTALATGAVVLVMIAILEGLEAMTPFRQMVNPSIAEFATQRWWAMIYLQLAMTAGIFAATRCVRDA